MSNDILYEKGMLAFDNGNIVLAKEIWEPLALNGDANAQIKMGDLYYRDPCITTDYTQALFWYRKAAAQNNAQGLLMIGYFYQSGLGVEANLDQAIEWYKKSAEFDSPKACFNLGLIYNSKCFRMEPFRSRNDDDALEAMAWFLTGAELGHPESQAMIGLQYCGVDFLKEDLEKALYWLRLAAPNVPEAMGSLANLYADGKGVTQNKKIAYVLYLIALTKDQYVYTQNGQKNINAYEALRESMSLEEIELANELKKFVEHSENIIEALGA